VCASSLSFVGQVHTAGSVNMHTSRGAERRNFCGLLVLGRVEQQVWDIIRGRPGSNTFSSGEINASVSLGAVAVARPRFDRIAIRGARRREMLRGSTNSI
jgi:hypothetical protein